MSKSGYMAFRSDAPLIGLDPHPGWAPQDNPSTKDAAGWFEAYGCCPDKKEVETEVGEDYVARLIAVEEGDLEDADDPDVIFPVVVHDDGRLEVFQENPRHLIADYTVEQIYDAFGMTVPTPL